VASSLAESYLLLSGDQQLRVADILRQAQRHDSASPGFLAVLSACMTDLANTDHDEALTLASALLAAGASGVVGARWPVRDDATALIMLMFHHFLNNGQPNPADALRAAQLWMLDPARLVLAGLPEDLDSAANSALFLTKPYSWAAFTYQGAYNPG
jgi:CHAT domain-containing protein